MIDKVMSEAACMYSNNKGIKINKTLNSGNTNTALCVQLCHASFHTLFLLMTTPSYRKALIQPFKRAFPNMKRRRSVEPM